MCCKEGSLVRICTNHQMFIKIHRAYRSTVSLCDADLIGKKFEDEKKQLDLRENFYKDKKITEEEAIKIIKNQSKEDSTFNIVGEKSINTALKSGIINKSCIDYIKNIPFTLVL